MGEKDERLYGRTAAVVNIATSFLAPRALRGLRPQPARDVPALLHRFGLALLAVGKAASRPDASRPAPTAVDGLVRVQREPDAEQRMAGLKLLIAVLRNAQRLQFTVMELSVVTVDHVLQGLVSLHTHSTAVMNTYTNE